MKIQHTCSEGYLKGPRFTNGLSELIESCIEELKNVDSVTVNLIEIFPHLNDQKVIETFVYSEDGRDCIVNITSYKGEDKNNKYTLTPKPKNLFRTLQFLLKKMLVEHSEKFPSK